MSVVSVDELCRALEATLRAHLAATATALGFTHDPVKTWQQVPSLDALSTAQLPGVAITSPGLVNEPTRSRASGTMKTTWRLAAGIYVNGRDHAETQKLARDWIAAMRTTALRHPTLGGIATGTTWAGESYADRPDRRNARTLAAGAIAFNVSADVLADPTAGTLPPVTTTPTTLSVQ